MKFVYIGDPHERTTTPVNRTDDYHETYKNKVNEIKKLATKHKAKALLQPGDFLDGPKFDINFLEEVIQRWSMVPTYELLTDLRLGKRTPAEVTAELSKGIPFIGAIGNHELYGENIKSYPKTSLAYLEKIGFMILPTKDKPFIFTDDDGTTVAITCTNYHSRMDTTAFLDDYIVEKKLADYHIHMVHGYLTNKDMGDMFNHTTLDKIAYKTEADLTIAGHDHIGFPLTEVDGKLFINPGSMTRTKSDVKEIRRRPKALVIEVTKDSGVTVKEHKLVSAKKGSDILSRESIEAKTKKSKKMEEIKSIVNKAQLSKGSSITSIISSISDIQDFDESLTTQVLDKVTSKMKEMDNSFDEDVKDYTIDKLVLTNFQGHKNSELNFGKGMNVVIGESSHGKSAIHRALHWLYDNAGNNPRNYIKKGTDFAKVTAHLSNGMVVSRIVESKKSGKNGYEVYDPSDGTLEYSNTKSINDIRSILGYNKIKLDTGKDVDINFMGQGESWFFIGNAFTSSERAKIIGSIFGTHYTDAVMKELESEIKKTDTKIKDKETDLKKTIVDIEQYEYLEDVKSLIEKADKMEYALNEKIKRKEKIQELVERKNRLDIEEKRLNDILDSLKDISTYQVKLYKLKEKIQSEQTIARLHDKKMLLKTNQENAEKLINSLIGLNGLTDRVSDLKSKAVQKEKLTIELDNYRKTLEKQNQINKGITINEKIISELSRLPELSNRIVALKNKTNTFNQLSNLKEKRNDTEDRINTGIKFVENSYVERNALVQQYQNILMNAGTCPTCHGTIDGAVVNRIVAAYSHN